MSILASFIANWRQKSVFSSFGGEKIVKINFWWLFQKIIFSIFSGVKIDFSWFFMIFYDFFIIFFWFLMFFMIFHHFSCFWCDFVFYSNCWVPILLQLLGPFFIISHFFDVILHSNLIVGSLLYSSFGRLFQTERCTALPCSGWGSNYPRRGWIFSNNNLRLLLRFERLTLTNP